MGNLNELGRLFTDAWPVLKHLIFLLIVGSLAKKFHEWVTAPNAEEKTAESHQTQPTKESEPRPRDEQPELEGKSQKTAEVTPQEMMAAHHAALKATFNSNQWCHYMGATDEIKRWVNAGDKQKSDKVFKELESWLDNVALASQEQKSALAANLKQEIAAIQERKRQLKPSDKVESEPEPENVAVEKQESLDDISDIGSSPLPLSDQFSPLSKMMIKHGLLLLAIWYYG